MGDVSIIKGTTTFTFQSGDVETVDTSMIAQLDENPLPASDTSMTFVIDYNGSIKSINIQGKITAATTTRTSTGLDVKSISEQITWLHDNLISGSQSGMTLNSTYNDAINVYVRKFNYKEQAGMSNFADFSIEFVEGA